MAKTLRQEMQNGSHPIARQDASATRDWRKRISDHVAFALLVYTAMQIFVTMAALKSGSGSLLPYFALVVLVLATIPGCRLFEARWTELSDEDAHDPALAPRFTRDVIVLWVLAFGLPLALTGGYLAIASLFG